MRNQRTEWLKAGVFNKLVEEAIAGYDKIIVLDLSEITVEGSPLRRRDWPQPHRPGQDQLEVGARHRPVRDPDRPGDRGAKRWAD